MDDEVLALLAQLRATASTARRSLRPRTRCCGMEVCDCDPRFEQIAEEREDEKWQRAALRMDNEQ